MNALLTALGSLIALTMVGRLVKPHLGFDFCAICSGVSLTWIWISGAIVFGYLDFKSFELPLALLLGGTAVGLAYQGEYRFQTAAKYPLVWKTVVIVLGILVGYGFLSRISAKTWLVLLGLMLIIGYLYFIRKPGTADNPTVAYLEEKLKRCC